jgi:hypothetical protein
VRLEYLPVKNLTEQRVVAAVGHAAGQSLRVDCGCPVCLAQVASLALNRLPPRYCLEHSFGLSTTRGISPLQLREALAYGAKNAGVVHLAVTVTGGGAARVAPIVNLAREQVTVLVARALREGTVACGCANCLADIMNLALNALPHAFLPEVLLANPNHRDPILPVERSVKAALEKATGIARKHPHHT